MREFTRFAVHNLVAHPLLVLCPPLGEALHAASAPGDEVAQPIPLRPVDLDGPTQTSGEESLIVDDFGAGRQAYKIESVDMQMDGSVLARLGPSDVVWCGYHHQPASWCRSVPHGVEVNF